MSFCRDCAHFDPQPRDPRPVPGFGRCRAMPAYYWLSPVLAVCRFHPSRWSPV